jgi:hypothetical protein
MATYTRHFLSAAWPNMSAEDHQALRDSITSSGLREPIVLLNGEILDGWQRYTACLAECIEPRFVEFEGDDPADFVRDKHTRRPLSLTQRLTAIARMYTWRPAGRPNNSAVNAEFSAAEMAKLAGASTRSAEYVKAAITHGTPEVVEAMAAGKLTATRAAEIVKLPEEKQAAAITAPKPARLKGKPLKGPAADLVRAELKAASAKSEAGEATAKVEELEAELSVLREQVAEARDDLDAAVKVLDASDQVATALAEAKKVRDLNRGLQSRIDSMLTEIADLKRSVKHWQRKAGQPA